MKIFSILLTFCVMVSVSAASKVELVELLEDSPVNRSIQAKRYISVNPPEEIFQGIAERAKGYVPAREQQTFVDMLTQYLDMEVLTEAMEAAIIKHFTAQEISALADFYSLPGSKSAMNKMEHYMAEMIPVVQKEMIKAQEKAFQARGTTQ